MREEVIKRLLSRKNKYDVHELYFSTRINSLNLIQDIGEAKAELIKVINDTMYPEDSVYNSLAGDTNVLRINTLDECICKFIQVILKHREEKISVAISDTIVELIGIIPERPTKEQKPVLLRRIKEMLEAIYSTLASLSSSERDEVFPGVLALKYYALMSAAYNVLHPCSQKYSYEMIMVYNNLYEKEQLLREKHRIDIARQWVK